MCYVAMLISTTNRSCYVSEEENIPTLVWMTRNKYLLFKVCEESAAFNRLSFLLCFVIRKFSSKHSSTHFTGYIKLSVGHFRWFGSRVGSTRLKRRKQRFVGRVGGI